MFTLGLRLGPKLAPEAPVLLPTSQGPENHTNIKEYFPDMGLDVLPGVPGRRAVSHDRFLMGLAGFSTNRSENHKNPYLLQGIAVRFLLQLFCNVFRLALQFALP